MNSARAAWGISAGRATAARIRIAAANLAGLNAELELTDVATTQPTRIGRLAVLVAPPPSVTVTVSL
jgi:hypothetical protein